MSTSYSPSDSKPINHYRRGEHYVDQERWDDAIRELRSEVKVHPDNTDAHYQLGIAYFKNGQIGESIQRFQVAVRIDPNHVKSHHNLALAYKLEKRWEDAIREAEAVLRIDPDFENSHYTYYILGEAYARTGSLERAIAGLETALRLGCGRAGPLLDTVRRRDCAGLQQQSSQVHQSSRRSDQVDSQHTFESGADVRSFLDHVFARLSDQDTTVKKQVRSWLREKRRSYSGSAYLDQMERNAIYLFERVRMRNATSAFYLQTGQPTVNNQEQAINYMRALEIEEAQEGARAHIQYVRTGTCPGCSHHGDHHRYAAYRKLRQTGSLSEYLDTVEFDAVYYQGLLITAGALLTSLLVNHQFAGSAREVPRGEIVRVVAERVEIHWNLWSGNVTSPQAQAHTPWISRILQ